MAKVKMGIYQHYKGPLYQVFGLAHDANDPDRICVVYIALELNGAHLGPRLAVRTKEDFQARVMWDGVAVVDRPRFQYLGPELTLKMVADRRRD